MWTPLMARSGPVYHCLKKFKKIYIEITNRCNLSCSFCHRSQRPKAEMTSATFAVIIDRIKEYTDHLALHVLGEPLLHPDLGEVLAICHQHRLRVNLTTNGTLLSRCRETLLSSPALRQLNISLHSFPEQGNCANLNEYLAQILSVVRCLTAETET
ncbi:MAG: radical SAM protein, partial [Desulfobulbaceae bacterium]|nr:radical SAM protein [Desulfobulbaceae bacterium]